MLMLMIKIAGVVLGALAALWLVCLIAFWALMAFLSTFDRRDGRVYEDHKETVRRV